MHALTFRRFGGPDALEWTVLPDPAPAPGIAVVRTRAIGVNIAPRRNQFAFAKIGLWRIAVAVLLWFVLVALHPLVYGVDPWRYVA